MFLMGTIDCSPGWLHAVNPFPAPSSCQSLESKDTDFSSNHIRVLTINHPQLKASVDYHESIQSCSRQLTKPKHARQLGYGSMLGPALFNNSNFFPHCPRAGILRLRYGGLISVRVLGWGATTQLMVAPSAYVPTWPFPSLCTLAVPLVPVRTSVRWTKVSSLALVILSRPYLQTVQWRSGLSHQVRGLSPVYCIQPVDLYSRNLRKKTNEHSLIQNNP